eukprot:4948788-Pleurochrysis_carterae.AAC.2
MARVQYEQQAPTALSANLVLRLSCCLTETPAESAAAPIQSAGFVPFAAREDAAEALERAEAAEAVPPLEDGSGAGRWRAAGDDSDEPLAWSPLAWFAGSSALSAGASSSSAALSPCTISMSSLQSEKEMQQSTGVMAITCSSVCCTPPPGKRRSLTDASEGESTV